MRLEGPPSQEPPPDSPPYPLSTDAAAPRSTPTWSTARLPHPASAPSLARPPRPTGAGWRSQRSGATCHPAPSRGSQSSGGASGGSRRRGPRRSRRRRRWRAASLPRCPAPGEAPSRRCPLGPSRGGRRGAWAECEASRGGGTEVSTARGSLPKERERVSRDQHEAGQETNEVEAPRTQVVGHDRDHSAEDATSNDVRRVVSVVHRAAHGNEGRADGRRDGNPRLKGVPAPVHDVHLAAQVHREVEQAGPGDCGRIREAGELADRESRVESGEGRAHEACPDGNDRNPSSKTCPDRTVQMASVARPGGSSGAVRPCESERRRRGQEGGAHHRRLGSLRPRQAGSGR